MADSQGKDLWLRLATALAVAALPLLGCQSVANSSPSQTQVRVIDASYNAPAVDVDIATTAIAANIGAATFSNYAFLPPENATAYVYPTGTTKSGASVDGQFLVNEQHSILIADSGKGYTASILTDQPTAAPAGYFSIRFLQQALQAGAVDIYLVPDGGTLAGREAAVHECGTAVGGGLRECSGWQLHDRRDADGRDQNAFRQHGDSVHGRPGADGADHGCAADDESSGDGDHGEDVN